jgi:phosphoglucosamine mutase
MSNLGLKLAMERFRIRMVQTAVGDRYVLEEMRTDGYSLGGEQSGHVVMLDHSTTGDGILTGLHLLARMAQTGRTAGRPVAR